MPEIKSNKTDFGFEEVTFSEKTRRVKRVFQSVSDHYDLMNDLMSLGIHRAWKRYAINMSNISSGDNVLDVAGGTGDITELILERLNDSGQVIMSDINPNMLSHGRDRLINKGLIDNVDFVLSNAESLPFGNNTFDCVTISFGIRNVSRKEDALSSIFNSLKYGGRIIILEFSKVVLPLLRNMYELYSFHLIPKLGELVSNDRESYQYLVESIRQHPDQNDFAEMIKQAGFSNVTYNNLSGGIVAVHRGFKI